MSLTTGIAEMAALPIVIVLMGSQVQLHFHNWIDDNGVIFLVQLLEWGQ